MPWSPKPWHATAQRAHILMTQKPIQYATKTIISFRDSMNALLRRSWSCVKKRPIEFMTIPVVSAFVGISTNYAGVQMLFYPIEYFGTDTVRFENAPYGIFGWQGVVPARTEKMASRLVDIVTRRLLSLSEAFSRLDAGVFSSLLSEPVSRAISEECGPHWALLLKPILPMILHRVVSKLQQEIDSVLDLPKLVLNSFLRDKVVLVELFQKVGQDELDFLVKSGLGFGFLLGIPQMLIWSIFSKPWTLPVAGALVGYLTNLVAIKLLFEPAEPLNIGPLTVQGLFEARQNEVSHEFAHFMETRVLSSAMLLDALANQNEQDLFMFLRKQLPYPVPEKIIRAAIKAIRDVASNPKQYPEIHDYVTEKLCIEDTLAHRLKQLDPKSFEDLLHPVFQEDEIILIVVGGILGAFAGVLQTKFTFQGTNARVKSVVLLLSCLVASFGFWELSGKEIETQTSDYEPVIDKVSSKLRRRSTILKTPLD